MWITPAYAQAAGGGGGDFFITLLPLILIFAVFYFLLIRPQQKKMREHQQMIESLKKGDTVVTGGGIVGKITKVEALENTVQVEIAPGVQVKVVKQTISDVLGKSKAQAAKEQPGQAQASAAGGGLFARLFPRAGEKK